MKVYVDSKDMELTKELFDRANVYDWYNCNLDDELELVSLTDYTKQVRKEAVKQVLDFIEEHKEYYFEKRDYYGVEYIFFNRSNLEKDILKQIQGETKC